MRNFIYFLIVFVLIAFNLKATEISGVCFEDLNKNMLFDAYEKGIPNVLISNGRDVIKVNNDETI